jgi:steroid 5-alpha reductase family enzyme
MRSLAVPVVTFLEQAATWSKTVEPYYSQLQALPSQLMNVAAGRETLLELYVNTNPLVTGFAVSVALGAVFLVVAEITRNYSQVDRCWSILPTFYNAHFALWARLAGYPHQRVDAVLLWSVIWSVSPSHVKAMSSACTDLSQTRLTFNYWRRGGYQKGSEDYRWYESPRPCRAR